MYGEYEEKGSLIEMEESYTLTVIEDQAVPLAATPGGGIPVAQTLFIIAVLCVMAGCAVYFFHRYLERCRQLRMRIAQLNDDAIVVMPSYENAPLDKSEHKYDLHFLEGEVARIEQERIERIL